MFECSDDDISVMSVSSDNDGDDSYGMMIKVDGQ
jgi:hypothetical protein